MSCVIVKTFNGARVSKTITLPSGKVMTTWRDSGTFTYAFYHTQVHYGWRNPYRFGTIDRKERVS